MTGQKSNRCNRNDAMGRRCRLGKPRTVEKNVDNNGSTGICCRTDGMPERGGDDLVEKKLKQDLQ